MENRKSGRSGGSWKNVLLLLLSLCLAVAIAEVLVRLFVPVRDVGPLFTVNDPVLGKRIKKNFHTVRVTPEFTMTFTSNSLGYRGPEPTSPPAGSVVFMGDSFTMGFGVNDGEEYPALIKARFDAIFGSNAPSVLNTGLGNNGNGRWIKLLKSEVDRFKPRLVVLQVTANDYEDNVREAYFSVSDTGTLNELPIKLSKAKSLEPILDAIPGVSSSYLYSLIRQSFAAPLFGAIAKESRMERVDNYADRLTERLITEAVSICKRRAYPMFAILVGLEGDRLGRVQAMFSSQQIPVFSVPTKTERPDLYYRMDGHWNPAGHAFVAAAVFDRLQSLIRNQER